MKNMKYIKIALFTVLCATFTSCYSWFESKVAMDTSSTTGTLSDLIERSATVDKLDTPTQIFISNGMYAGKILVSWTEVDYATSYRVEYAEVQPDENGDFTVPSEEDFCILEEYCSETSCTHEILSDPGSSDSEYKYRYFYRVSAQNIGEGIEASDFTEVGATRYGTLFAPPASIDAAKGKSHDEVTVTWSEADNAVSYYVYWGTYSDGRGMVSVPDPDDVNQILTILSGTTTYSDETAGDYQGTYFYYKVCAKNTYGNLSAFTELAMGYTVPDGAPDAPTDITVTNGNAQSTSKLILTWTATSEDSSGGTITYDIYRNSSADSVYTRIATGVTRETVTYTDEASLKTGLYYYYYIQPTLTNTDGTTVTGGFSDSGPDSDSPAVGFLLSPPSSISVNDGSDDDHVTLVWSQAIGADSITYAYNIYYCDTSTGTYSPLVTNIEGTLNSSSYREYEVLKKNFYKISTYNASSSDETESALSSAVAPSPNAPVNVTASKTANLSSSYSTYWTANTNEVYPILITWSAPTTGSTPAGYYIYRSTKKNTGFKKLTNSAITTTYYLDTDNTTKAGVFYYYKVISLNSLGQGNKGNDPSTDAADSTGWGSSWGYGAITRDQWLREYNKTIMQSQTKMTYMYKSGTDALGTETANGAISGTLYFNSAIAGLGAYITMLYTNYADYYINDDSSLGVYFLLDGNTNTSCNMSANGNMEGTNTAGTAGMYPGYIIYDNLEIASGAAGGGYYIVCTKDKTGSVILEEGTVSWLVGEE